MSKVPVPAQHRRHTRQQLGRFGEEVAAGYLARRGHVIVARNWRCQTGEIDLVAREGTQWVFVEVRTRRAGSTTGPTPEESITPAKREQLIVLANTYLQQLAQPGELGTWVSWRIDVVAIEVGKNGGVVRLEHITNAIEGA